MKPPEEMAHKMALLSFFLCFFNFLECFNWCSAASSSNSSLAMLSAACSLSLMVLSSIVDLDSPFTAFVLACKVLEIIILPVFSSLRIDAHMGATAKFENNWNKPVALWPEPWYCFLTAEQTDKKWSSQRQFDIQFHTGIASRIEAIEMFEASCPQQVSFDVRHFYRLQWFSLKSPPHASTPSSLPFWCKLCRWTSSNGASKAAQNTRAIESIVRE